MNIGTIIRKPDTTRDDPHLLFPGRDFWKDAASQLARLPNNAGLNIAHEAVDKHLTTAVADRVALRWISKREDSVRDITYRALSAQTNQFANVLQTLGVGQGDRVFSLAGRVPELYIAALGVLKNRSVFCPLFSAFGKEPIKPRMQIGEGKALITTPKLYAKKIAPIREALPALKHVILIGAGAERFLSDPGVVSFADMMTQASPEFTIGPTHAEDMALLHFTSGTTGKPKGAVHVHQAVLSHMFTGRLALDLNPGDVYWCTADPGWVTGTSYGLIAPLTNGVTMLIDEGGFNADRWYAVLAEHRVNVWYTAPTAVRMMMKAGEARTQGHDLSQLRFIASVGEPLNPEAVWWGQRAFGLPIHDNYWQTETGGIMVANVATADIKPGSMGRPLPGINAVIVEEGEDGHLRPVAEPGIEGMLGFKPGWPSMFRGYLGEEARYAACFRDGFYLTGDIAKQDDDGYLWFVGRADDVINTAGHLVSPFEVESVLLEHPAVAEAGVIGKPDAMAMEIVKAFVALKPGHEASNALKRELIGLTRTKLGAALAPRELQFTPDLPKTRSGKIMRRLLKARELGLPEGDTSTLEQPAQQE